MLGNTNSYADYDSYAAGKANVGLDNLAAAGQMIIDSQNGTISNCILEIPQNLKLSIVNNVVTLDIGSIVTLFGNTYSTYTTTTTKTWTTPNTNGRYMLFATVSADEYIYSALASHTFSGTTYPDSPSFGDIFFDTSNKSIHRYTTQWVNWGVGYPIAIADITNGVPTLAKDSKGRDLIFNGCGYIGHHAFVYPNIRKLSPDGFSSNGNLSSVGGSSLSLSIIEMTNAENSVYFNPNGTIARGYISYWDSLAVAPQNSWKKIYVRDINKSGIYYNNVFTEISVCAIAIYTYDGAIVTDFTIRQPYEGARNLLTDDIEEQIGDIDTILHNINSGS